MLYMVVPNLVERNAVHGKQQSIYRGRWKIGRVYLPLSWRVHYKLCKWCWIEWKGVGRAPPTLTSLGRFFHRNGMYARKWPLPLCLYSVWQTIPSREKCSTVHDALFLVERKAVHDNCFLWKGMLYVHSALQEWWMLNMACGCCR
jgi:hypothetical protein